MKSRHIVGMISGAAIGMVLGYFSAGSVAASNLLIGALIGGLIGLYIVTAATVPPGRETSGEQSRFG